jgi:ABC-2 type transport system ATP-binding protein
MHSSSAAIAAHLLAKTYGAGKHVAVADLTLEIQPGCVFGFLGPNGAGKTTAIKMLLGLTRPSSGEATLFGTSVASRYARKRVGYLPELFRYPSWSTASEVLAFHCALADVARSDRPAEIERVLSVVGLASRAGERAGTFSKGMQQRLGLAVALLGRPRLIFLDEPTSALDPVGRVDVRDILRALRESETTVFINSHLLTEVEQICDRVAFFRNGRIVSEGTIAAILGSPKGVLIRIDGSAGEREAVALRQFGDAVIARDEIVLAGLAPERIPDVVAALVSAGSRVSEVQPRSRSLEQRFMELMAN